MTYRKLGRRTEIDDHLLASRLRELADIQLLRQATKAVGYVEKRNIMSLFGIVGSNGSRLKKTVKKLGKFIKNSI